MFGRFGTTIEEIGDILQLANGLNGPNRLNLTKVRISARKIDMKSLGLSSHVDACQHRHNVQECLPRSRGELPSDATMSRKSLTA